VGIQHTLSMGLGRGGGSVDMAMSPAIQHVAPTDIERKVTATASEGHAGLQFTVERSLLAILTLLANRKNSALCGVCT
jgi:hypothetical protein